MSVARTGANEGQRARAIWYTATIMATSRNRNTT